ncbi:MAG: 16S rRNA (uracil(1498)-N(3))-methyltransferase [Kiritimatiellae bacterium]|nr:16S rRNA (uracil(1498)-N(3))-methyltransferase [Kiritimatiellia bacterium]
MHRHLVTTDAISAGRITLDRSEARHFATVLRLGAGDDVELFDGKGSTARFRIVASERSSMTLERQGDARLTPPPQCRLILGACISKGKRMDWTIEKAVELGAAEIIPIASRFSVVRVADDEAKRERWERIAIDAARQSSAAYLPEITEPMSFDDAMARIDDGDPGTAIFAGALQPDAIPLRDAIAARRALPCPVRRAAWLVGPEGDFSPEEYAEMRRRSFNFVSLGDTVLRTETAAIYGLCVLGAEYLVKSSGANS